VGALPSEGRRNLEVVAGRVADERMPKSLEQAEQGGGIALFRASENLFDLMVAGDDPWIGCAHGFEGLRDGARLAVDAGLPAGMPGLEFRIVVAGVVGWGVTGQGEKGVGVIGVGALHPAEQVCDERVVAVFAADQTQFGAQAILDMGAALVGEEVEESMSHGDGLVVVVVEKGKECFGEAGKIPAGDGWLLAKGVAAVAVDGTVHGAGIIGVHEGAGTVVDGFAGEGHVVGVHDTVDETDEGPLGEEGGLACDGELQESAGGFRIVNGIGDMATEGVAGEQAQGLEILEGGNVLEGADADVAGGDAGQNGAGEGAIAEHRFAGGGNGQGPGGGNAQGVHGLAHEVFAQHGAEGGASVAATGVRGGAGAFELNIDASPIRREVLAQNDGPPVAQQGEVAELMPGIGLRDGLGAVGQGVASKDDGVVGAPQDLRIEPEFPGKRFVKQQEPRGGDGEGLRARVQQIGQVGGRRQL